MKRITWILLLLMLTSGSWLDLQAQTDTVKVVQGKDSIKPGFVEKMQRFARRSSTESRAEFEADKAAMSQVKIFEQVKRTMQSAKIYLNAGVDTAGTKAELAQIRKDFLVAEDGVLTAKGSAQTFRNLTATEKVLNELLSTATARKVRLDRYRQDLSSFRYQLDSLLSLPDLFKFPVDSVVLSGYIQQIRMVSLETHPIDSALKQTAMTTQHLLDEVNLQVLNIQASLEEIALYQRKMAVGMFNREFNNLWEPLSYSRPFPEILGQAIAKGKLTLLFYLQNNLAKVIIMVILMVASCFYLRSLRSIYHRDGLLSGNYEGQLVLKNPVAAAVLIVISLFQFIFFSPPFLFNVILWTAASISLSILFRGFITSYWMKVWLSMVGFFLIASLDNLILQASRGERWLMLFTALAGILAGVIILLYGRRKELRERLILVAIGLMAFLELGSAMANLFGRYNLSKALLITGFLNVVVAILFLWTVRLINEGLYLAFNVYTRQDPKLFYLNFDKLGNKVPPIFYALLVFGWAILFGRNFAGFDYVSGPVQDFLSQQRTLGDYTFSINSLLLFVVIMGISVAVSKIVSFFASDRHIRTDKDHQKERGLGSWLLLIRIFILSMGLFLAIAATGIPVDRITIVLGALGVGIGFGLQTLVNNLVSGLIIAFEKPVNVGDVIEVDGQGGTMKSIGFRSSIISTWDGADVVLPNGDLLNAHLTNWTMGGRRKRMTITLGLAYDTDLEKARQVLSSVLDEAEHIMKNPAPSVLYEQFGDSSIGLKIFFWTKDLGESGKIKSELIISITQALRTNKIIVPFPQQDLYLHPVDNNKNS
ncbi:MAG: mechanosensitive ion channel domain-containing protein [Bacteroidota bacterium]